MSKEKFEESLERLEEIVRRMEAGEMTLEESLKAF
jgi:exodeoxyribonuclease VII small subunit